MAKNLPPHYRRYPNKRCIFLFWGFPEHERERFSWKLWHCQTPPPLMRGKVFGFVFALDSSSTGSDVPAPSLSLGEESPSCGNGKSSQRPTRVTHLSNLCRIHKYWNSQIQWQIYKKNKFDAHHCSKRRANDNKGNTLIKIDRYKEIYIVKPYLGKASQISFLFC